MGWGAAFQEAHGGNAQAQARTQIHSQGHQSCSAQLSNALLHEAEYVTREGICYIQIPVEWEQPEYAQLLQFFGILNVLEGQRIWVHYAKTCGYQCSFICIVAYA